ncbi:MAG TPA: helix-turn-helix domain-containing protein [Planctomycetota bacterium]|nr:helix-turn-helix domain-containing protein [Planctomycetota bacterium]
MTEGAKRKHGTSTETLPDWALDLLESLPPLLSTKEAAESLRVSEKTVRRRIREGLLPCVRGGRFMRIPRLALVNFMVRPQDRVAAHLRR